MNYMWFFSGHSIVILCKWYVKAHSTFLLSISDWSHNAPGNSPTYRKLLVIRHFNEWVRGTSINNIKFSYSQLPFHKFPLYSASVSFLIEYSITVLNTHRQVNIMPWSRRSGGFWDWVQSYRSEGSCVLRPARGRSRTAGLIDIIEYICKSDRLADSKVRVRNWAVFIMFARSYTVLVIYCASKFHWTTCSFDAQYGKRRML